LWNAISAPIVFLMLPEIWQMRQWPALLALLFPIVGTWLLYRAVIKTLQRRRFGELRVALSPSPGVLGSVLTGSIELPERFGTDIAFRVTLNCVHHRVTGRGRDSTTWESSVWQDQTTAQSTPSGRGTRLLFRLSTSNVTPPTEPESDNHHYWKLRVHAELPGVNLDHSFEIPMVKGAVPAGANPVPAELRRTGAPEFSTRVVRLSREGGAVVLYYPAFRSPRISLGLLLFGVLCLGSATFIYHAVEGPFALAFGGIFIGVFGLVGAGLALLGLYMLVNSLRVELSPRGVTTTRRAFGLKQIRQVTAEDVTGIERKITSQQSGGDEFRVRYTLYAMLRNGRKLAVGDDIPGPELAEYLSGVVRQALNLK
jgi:hypothetical protein